MHQARFTSLDRAIRKSGQLSPDGATITIGRDVRSAYAKRRLIVLQEMGLAEQKSADKWRVNANFEHILREMQKVADRQKTLAAHRALMSDPNLPFQVTDLRNVDQLQGRVLGHGEEESTGRTYMLLEGDDQKVHFIYHNRPMQRARHEGRLSPNSQVILSSKGERVEHCELPKRVGKPPSEKHSTGRSR